MAPAALVVGAGAGYATVGFADLGPLASAGVAATVMTGVHAVRAARGHRQRAWLGVMDAITAAAP